MGMLRKAALGMLVAILLAVVVGWNMSRFISSTAKIREKDIDFLPPPVVAELLCLGHRNTLAKLRWIDSFAYFEYQLDRKDDNVVGGGKAGGFERLYDTLITLDPHFQSFYEHAALNTGGLLGHQGVALSFQMRGISEMPTSSQMWRNAAAILRTEYHWQEQLPEAFGQFLSTWRRFIPEDSDQISIWLINVGRHFSSISQRMSYWLEQLHMTKAGSPAGDFVEGQLRDEYAKMGCETLQILVNAYRIAHGAPAPRLKDLWLDYDLIDPFSPFGATIGDAPPVRLDDVLEPRLLRKRLTRELQANGPIIAVDGRLRLRTDPFGLPWRLVADRVVSTGLERRHYQAALGKANVALLNLARSRGSWPASLAEARSLGLAIPEPPEGGSLSLAGEALEVTWQTQPGQPWSLR